MNRFDVDRGVAVLLAVVAVLIVVFTVTGCTRSETAKWLAWWQTDPVAAEEFAKQPHIQAELQQPQEVQTEPAVASSSTNSWGKWDPILQCESGGDWHIETGNGYSGGLQFAHSTWRAYGGLDYAQRASQAEPWQQIDIAERVLEDAGWSAWPTCARKAGYR